MENSKLTNLALTFTSLDNNERAVTANIVAKRSKLLGPIRK